MISDDQLIRKINRRQDKAAANELVQRYYKEIYIYVYRQVGERETAMDLTQDIFVSILQGIHLYDAKKASFRTWAYRIASNKLSDYWRKRAVVQNISQSDAITEKREYTEDKQEQDVLALMIERETLHEVMGLVYSFDPSWADIFVHKMIMEETFSEISKQLRLSENTVKTRYYKVLKTIRKQLQK